MTQPAKAQEPSMEEILASIRRIIADDEAKPPAAEKPAVAAAPAKPEKPAAPAAKAPAMKDVPPSAIPAAQAAAAKAATPPPAAKPAPPPPPPPAAPDASNSQDDIDALLNGLDEATTPEEIRPPAPEAEAEVFDLTDEMVAEPAPPPPSFRKVEPPDDLEFAESAGARALHQHSNFEPPPLESGSPSRPILSHSTVSAVESAFNSLAHTVLSNNARTLEDLVKEMLRPMLKSWLDDNLPGLVERIVKAEIERVSRGR
jgi:uncharacterized protein